MNAELLRTLRTVVEKLRPIVKRADNLRAIAKDMSEILPRDREFIHFAEGYCEASTDILTALEELLTVAERGEE